MMEIPLPRLNVNGSFDIKKSENSRNLSLNFFSLKSYFLFFVQKMDLLTLSHMYEVTTFT